MADNSPPVRNVKDQPLAVDFIQNRLPQVHDAFKDFPVQYDPILKRFVRVPHAATMSMPTGHTQPGVSPGSFSQQNPLQQTIPLGSNSHRVPARELVPASCEMTFWNEIFDLSMERFMENNTEVPKKLVEKPEYGIRGLKDWDEIDRKMQKAQERFDGNDSSWRPVKGFYRRVLDRSGVASQAVKLLPEMDYTSPIKSVMEVLIDAAKYGSDVRNKVGSSFDGLELTFGKIEVFIATFHGDDNIRLASIDLFASILKAVEAMIAYFLSRTLKRMLGAVGQGSEYQKDLITSIDQISVKCGELVEKAQQSHISGTREGIEMVLGGIDDVVQLAAAIHTRGVIMDEKLDSIHDISSSLSRNSDITNRLLDLFVQGEKKKDVQHAEDMQRLQNFAEFLAGFAERVELRLRLVEEREKAHTPTPIALQQLQPLQAQLPWYPTQYLYPWRPQLLPQTQDQQGFRMPQQPWSAPRGVSPPPFWTAPSYMGPYSPQPPPESTMDVNALLGILGILQLNTVDITSTLDSAESLSLRYRSEAKRIIATDEFRTWATSSTSSELLIQGDTGKDTIQAGSALSLVCASLMQGLRSHGSFIALVFFCRQHVESDDEFAGPNAMLRSLTAQLLWQHFADHAFRQQEIDLEGLRSRDIDAVCVLFKWLVQRITQRKTLVCVLDGVEAYETAKYEDDLRKIVAFLLGLERDSSLEPSIKVLVTTAEAVSLEQDFTRGDSSVLLVEGLLSGGDEEGMFDLEDMSQYHF